MKNSFDDRGLDVYPVYPEALPPAPRRVAISLWAHVKRLSLWVCLLVCPSLALGIGYRSAEDFRLLRDCGVEVPGKVDSRWIWNEFDSNAPTTYHVSFSFYVAGQLYAEQKSVTKSEYAQLHEGAQISVTYLPSDPSINCLGSPDLHLHDRIEFTRILAALIAVGSAILAVWFEWTVRGEVRLATHGVGSIGRIIDNGTERWMNYSYFWASCEFTLPTGRRATKRHYVPQLIWELVPRGQAVTILYDPECPSRHLPLYAFKHVRVTPVPLPTPAPLDPSCEKHAFTEHYKSDAIQAHIK